MTAAVLLILLSPLLGQIASDPLGGLFETGQWADAVDGAEQRLMLDPEDDAARYWLARSIQAQALELLRRPERVARGLAGGMLERSVDHYGQLILDRRAHPDDVLELWLLARYQRLVLDRDDPNRDADVLRAITERFVSDLDALWESKGEASAAWLRGRMARELGEPEAVTWLERAVQADGGRGTFALHWADALAEAGDRGGALQAWLAAVEAEQPAELDELLAALLRILPGSEAAAQRLGLLDLLQARKAWAADAYLGWYRAQALEELGDLEGAEAALRAGNEGRTARLVRDHALVLARLDRASEAVELLAAVVEAGEWGALDDIVRIGIDLARRRQWDGALATFDLARELEPRAESVLWNRAITLWRAGRPERAEQAFIELDALRPDRADILNDGGLAAWGRAGPAAALPWLEAAVRLPDSEDARENLAVALLRIDPPDVERAIGLLEQVLAVEPDRDRALFYRHRARRLRSR